VDFIADLQHELAQADGLATAGSLVTACLAREVGVAAINIFPLFAGATPESEVVVYTSEVCPEVFRRSTFEALALMDREFGTVSDQFPGESRIFDANQRMGWRRLQRSVAYNEFWRRFRIERQVLALLGEPTAPLGFIGVCRKLADRPFSTKDVARIDAIRLALQPKLAEIAAQRQGWLGMDVVLLALQAALPFPCGVFDENGRALWLNHAAEIAFGVRATKIGGLLIAAGNLAQLTSWRDAVLRARGGKLSPTDRVAVRRILREDRRPVYLVTGAGGGHGASGLSPRESEIADMAGRGYSVLNIAAQLGVAEGTVRNHLKKVYKKLGVNNRAQLAGVVWRHAPRAG
jgi:DNA-binding CsgD family transcriptional regulator